MVSSWRSDYRRSKQGAEIVERRVPKLVQVAYGAPALALALMGVTFYVYLPRFYSDVVGVPLAQLGWIILLSRVFDAVIDPALGMLSDRTRVRWGRRKPWIAAAAIPTGIAFTFLLVPPVGLDAAGATLWLTLWTFLFFFFWGMVTVPYEALGAEMSEDYDERTRLLGLRDGLLILGTLLSAVFPAVLERMAGDTSGSTERRNLGILAVGYAVLLVVLVAWCLVAVQERRWSEGRRPKGALLGDISSALANRPFAILLLAYTIMAFGGELPATLLLYYVKYVLGSENASLFLALYFGIGFTLLPFWIRLAGRFGKKQTWMLAMAINTGAFSLVLFLGPGDTELYTVLVCLSAVGYGATLAIPSSMQADVIDYEEWRSGTRREGQFVGFWLIARKLARAFGAGIAFPILDQVGYVPNEAQTPTVLWTLTLLYAGVPCFCTFVAMLVAWRYPIDRALHGRIRAEIEDRQEMGEA